MHVKNLVKNPSDQFEGDKQTNTTNTTTKKKSKEEEKEEETVLLKSSEVATFKVDIVAPAKEGTFHGQIFLKTLFEVGAFKCFSVIKREREEESW